MPGLKTDLVEILTVTIWRVGAGLLLTEELVENNP